MVALLVLAGLMACSNREPAQEDTVTPQAANLRQAVQEMFDTWTEAFRTRDAVLLHSTLSRDLAEICDTDKMQEWIERTHGSGPETQVVEVISVFVDAESPDRAMAELRFGAGPDGSTESESLITATAQFRLFPFPVLVEGGNWRAHFPYPVLQLAPQPCPFEIPTYLTSERDGGRDYLEIPGFDFSEYGNWSLDRPAPGTLRSFTSISSSGSAKEYEIVLSGIMGTPLASGDLMDLYKEHLVDPSWDIRGEGEGPKEHGSLGPCSIRRVVSGTGRWQ